MWVADFLARALTYSTPLMLAALGELYVERAGMLNLGVEGMIALSAALSVLAGSAYGPLAGIASALAGSLALSMLFRAMVRLGADQVVVGLSMVGAFYPAWRLRRLRPVDALRFV